MPSKDVVNESTVVTPAETEVFKDVVIWLDRFQVPVILAFLYLKDKKESLSPFLQDPKRATAKTAIPESLISCNFISFGLVKTKLRKNRLK